MIRLTLRHMSRHWRMNLALLLGLTLCVAMLAALPLYAALVASQNLSRSLQGAYAPVRNMSLHGSQLAEAFQDQVQPALGNLVQGSVQIQEAMVDVDRAIYRGGERHQLSQVLFVRLWSFEPLADHVQLLSGRLPSVTSFEAGDDTGVLEAVVGDRAAAGLDLAIGDELAPDDIPYRLRIVGIVTPLDPEEDMWWSDPTLSPFNVERQSGADVDSLYLSLLVPPETISLYVPEHTAYWRLLLDWAAIPGTDVVAFSDRLVALLSGLSARGIRAETGLTELLAQYKTRLAVGQISLILLTLQSLIAVLYVLGTLGAFAVNQSHSELATMAGRGFGVWRLTWIWSLQMGILACFSFLVGSALTYGVFWLRARLVGPAASYPPASYPAESWWLAAVAVVFGWLSLLIPLHMAVRQNWIDGQNWRVRPPRRPGWRRLVVDFLALALGGLAYWQLRDMGSLVRGGERAGELAADPVVLLGPTLLLLVVSLLFLRLVPFLLHGLSWMANGTRGLVLPLSLARLARSPGGLLRTTLLISLTTGLVLFAVVFQSSVLRRQQEIAHYMTGADIRVALPLDADRAAVDSAGLAGLTGVRAAAAVYRGQARWSPFETTAINARPVDLLAVEVPHLVRVAAFPSGIGRHSMSDLVALLEVCGADGDGCQDGIPDVLPAILSADAPPGNLPLGSQVIYYVGNQPCTFEVQAIISDWPTMSHPFLITNLDALRGHANLAQAGYLGSGWRELWLDVEPTYHARLVEQIAGQPVELADAAMFQAGRIAADAGVQLDVFQSDLISRIVKAAFWLNALVLVILSGVSLALVQFFEARSRAYEFGVLRVVGLAPRQFLGLLSLDGILALGLGLSVGSAVGCGLIYAMRPFLSLTLASSLGGYAIDRLHLPWAGVARFYAALIGVYAIALGLLLFSWARSRTDRTLRLGDE